MSPVSLGLSIATSAGGPSCAGEPGDTAGGWGCVETVRGWRVLDLHGTDRRVGELYGTLLRDELLGAWVPMNEHMHYDVLPAAFRHVFLRQQRRFPGYLDPRGEARAAGLETALGLPAGTVRRYAWLGDLGSIGPALQLALAGTVQLDAATGRVSDRCTSVVGRDGDATVHARNLDYWGMGYWQPHATVLFVEPLDEEGRPDGLRYAHVGTVGELFAGTTGVNEAGVAISTHLHVTRDVALVLGRMRMSPVDMLWEGLAHRSELPGTSVYTLVESVLRDARTVEDAVAILEGTPPVGAWSFVVSDPSGDRAVVAADHVDHHAVRGASVETNFYRDPTMHGRELHPSRGPLEGARLRYDRAEALLGAGDLDVERAVALLRDRFDLAVGRERPVSANSPLSPDTSQSAVVVSPPDGDPQLWLAEPFADGYTPAPLAPFVGFSFAAGMAGPGRELLGELPADPGDRRVLVAYVDAMRLALDERDRPAAAAALRAIDTDDPGVRLMAAWASAATGAEDLARAELARFDGDRASHHHRILAHLLDGELARRAGDPDAARAAWERGLAEATADRGPEAELDGPLALVLRDRLARADRRPRAALPFPDLKFQDVIELRLES